MAHRLHLRQDGDRRRPDELWANAQEHMAADHPDLVGKVGREDLLAQAQEA